MENYLQIILKYFDLLYKEFLEKYSIFTYKDYSNFFDEYVEKNKLPIARTKYNIKKISDKIKYNSYFYVFLLALDCFAWSKKEFTIYIEDLHKWSRKDFSQFRLYLYIRNSFYKYVFVLFSAFFIQKILNEKIKKKLIPKHNSEIYIENTRIINPIINLIKYDLEIDLSIWNILCLRTFIENFYFLFLVDKESIRQNSTSKTFEAVTSKCIEKFLEDLDFYKEKHPKFGIESKFFENETMKNLLNMEIHQMDYLSKNVKEKKYLEVDTRFFLSETYEIMIELLYKYKFINNNTLKVLKNWLPLWNDKNLG